MCVVFLPLCDAPLCQLAALVAVPDSLVLVNDSYLTATSATIQTLQVRCFSQAAAERVHAPCACCVT